MKDGCQSAVDRQAVKLADSGLNATRRKVGADAPPVEMSDSRDDASTLLIVGASARAAVGSARRAAMRVAAADLFGDVDLDAPVTTVPPDAYPQALVDAARSAPPGPWLYTGGLENHPDVVAAISAFRPLWGCAADVLRRVRSTQALADICRRADLPAPEAIDRHGNAPESGLWLRKPRRSAGGQRITRYAAPPYPTADGEFHWQRFLSGTPQSAVFAAGEQSIVLLGISEQLVGTAWTGAAEFQYCGSIGETDVPQTLVAQYERLGRALHEAFAVRGLVGVDAIVDDEGRVWPIEINPRYTASVEVLERLRGESLMLWHVRGCQRESLAASGIDSMERRAAGKVILFARDEYLVDKALVDDCLCENEGRAWPLVADIPRAGTRIELGQPVMTLLADGASADDVRCALRDRAAQMVARLESCVARR